MSYASDIFQQYSSKKVRAIVSLHSGTSVDGVDVAITLIEGSGREANVELIKYKTVDYSKDVTQKLHQLFDRQKATVEKICQAQFLLGKIFAEAATSVISETCLSLSEIDVIGSSGQITYHVRKGQDPGEIWIGDEAIQSGLDLGEGQVIAEMTGVPVVSNMRNADIAAGGQGNPLVTYGDWVLFTHPQKARIIQNIGGIANPTVLPANSTINDVIAFDTGPGNMLIDAVVQYITNGQLKYDKNGILASQGQVSAQLLAEMLKHPYLVKRPPKTTGREVFGEKFLQKFLNIANKYQVTGNDLVATATAISAESIVDNYQKFIFEENKIDEILLCGGGARNDTLVKMLQDKLSPIPIFHLENYTSIPAEAREVVAVGVITNETMLGNFANVANATGARHRAIMGHISLPPLL